MQNPVVAGIRITRNCNMMCPYCNIPNQPKKDLTLQEWKQALEIINKLNIKDLVILGGEPTMFSELPELIKYGKYSLGMNISMTTNARNNQEIIGKCIESGLNKLGVSVDTLNFKKSVSPMKCKCGLEMLDFVKQNYPDMNVVDYIVLNKQNIDDVISLVKYLSAKKVSSYFLPFHWGNEGSFEHRKNKDTFAFTSKEDIEKYENVIRKLIELKQAGYLIDNSIEFLLSSAKHIKKLDWKCTGLYELRVDSDGQMVCCCDKFGSVNKQFSIFNLEENFDEFRKQQLEDIKECSGCLWPSAFEAELKAERR